MTLRMGDFRIADRMMRYSVFIPRFYNLCLSFGFQPGRIMPSRAFCSDESQGFPIILIAKHFGAFPFDHGRVGGIVATGRHGPHAHHGRDLVILQASHVGYDPDERRFGVYRRLQTEKLSMTASCGKIGAILDWYLKECTFARESVLFTNIDGQDMVLIDNYLLDRRRREGLFLHLERIIEGENDGPPEPLHVFSTSKAFRVHPDLRVGLPDSLWRTDRRTPIGEHLEAGLFHFKRDIPQESEGHDHLEHNLSHDMPRIITSEAPALAAAQVNTQIEFDRTYRTIVKERGYQGKNLAFIAGINIDISPKEGQVFPLTKFVPWAAYFQTTDGRRMVMEQEELFETLVSQPEENNGRIDLEEAIGRMMDAPEVKIDQAV